VPEPTTGVNGAALWTASWNFWSKFVTKRWIDEIESTHMEEFKSNLLLTGFRHMMHLHEPNCFPKRWNS